MRAFVVLRSGCNNITPKFYWLYKKVSKRTYITTNVEILEENEINSSVSSHCQKMLFGGPSEAIRPIGQLIEEFPHLRRHTFVSV